MKNEILLIELQYFTPIIFYKNLNKFSNIIFEQYEYYEKMSFRNRCQVAGGEGVINLSIPLLHGRDQRTLMKDVKISGKNRWQDQHWKTIVSCYSRSPWFEYYRDELGELYLKPYVFLMDWNLACFEWSLKALNIAPRYSLTDAYIKPTDVNEMVDWRNKLLPKNRKDGFDISIPEMASSVIYRQVFKERIGFLPNLSILDLLFCEGKRAGILLL